MENTDKKPSVMNQPITMKMFLIVSAVFFLLSAFQTCSTKGTVTTQVKKYKEEVNATPEKIDSMVNAKFEVILLKMEQEGYKMSSRALYNENAVVRTVARPDDIINGYNKEIDRLEKEIKKKSK